MEIKERFISSSPFSLISILLMQILVIGSLIASKACGEANINTDQAALVAVKAHITNDPFGIITNNWSTTSSVCNWVGIECGRKHNRVTGFNFSFMGLTATFPSQLGTLSFLTYITIKNNSFHGELPIELLNLPRLKVFSIETMSSVDRFRRGLGDCLEYKDCCFMAIVSPVPFLPPFSTSLPYSRLIFKIIGFRVTFFFLSLFLSLPIQR